MVEISYICAVLRVGTCPQLGNNVREYTTMQIPYDAMRRPLLTFLLSFFTIIVFAAPPADIKAVVRDWMVNYTPPLAYTSVCRLEDFRVNEAAKTILIEGSGGWSEQFFTEELVARLYREVHDILPSKYQDYKITLMAEGLPIEDLIPNAVRSGNVDATRQWRTSYDGRPWVSCTSRPYTISDGLDGEHIALWQSHGRYYNAHKGTWQWQRPRLYCTCEDLFTLSFVVPYIIPMLEDAGAVVYTPRERDMQVNEVIVDNDAPQVNGLYTEDNATAYTAGSWQATPPRGFAHRQDAYSAGDNPFMDGTAVAVNCVTDTEDLWRASWTPRIPATGRYAVYVSYATLPNSIDDAHYVVHHKGGDTHFRVNQQMGGSTWVYLGTFAFNEGENAGQGVELTNESARKGVVTADAVRFGGGMGNIARGAAHFGRGSTSGLPRWAEAAHYSSQWAGMPDSIYDYYGGADDYKSDILSRPLTVNRLAGGSVYCPEKEGRTGNAEDGRCVPFDLAIAFHSDAGYSETDEPFGSLSICSTLQGEDSYTDGGLNRYASHDLSSMLLANLRTDLAAYDWHVRKLWNKNYGETRVPQIPSVILEMLSHQNFTDLRLGYDPTFKFNFCRSVVKTIVKWEAMTHNRSYTIQPLPVKDFAVTLDEQRGEARLSWSPTDDPLEPTAVPTSYVLYIRTGDGDFDNGTVVSGTHCSVRLQQDVIYSFRVCALNDGGRSFPSETLAACISSRNDGTVLIVNGFTRLSGPAVINTSREQGFDLDADPGVPYGAFSSFCGRQINFDRSLPRGDDERAQGASGSELECQTVMGNTFDYAYLHGLGIAQTGKHSFASCSESAFIIANTSGGNQQLRAEKYRMIDLYYGVQTEFPAQTRGILDTYLRQGGRVFLSGANLLKSGQMNLPAMKTALAEVVQDNSRTEHISGSGTEFSIYRGMNSQSYAVPAPEALVPQGEAFAMLVYSDNQTAATAYNGQDYKTVFFGFPFESISNAETRIKLMRGVVSFLCK